MLKRSLLRKSLILSLTITSFGYGYAEAGVLTPGTVTPGTYTITSGQVGINTPGTYTIGSGSDTAIITYDGQLDVMNLSSGVTTINGNLNIQGKNSNDYTHGIVLGGGAQAIFNGNLDINVDNTAAPLGQARYISTSSANTTLTVNGTTKISVVSDGHDGAAESYTTIIADPGSTINFNGDVYLTNKIINYHDPHGGANGIYASGGTINFNGDTTRLFSIGDKPDTLTSYNNGVININSKTTQVIGNIDFKEYDNGTVNAVLDGSKSFWYGDVLNETSDAHMNITLQNGAEYIPFGVYSENIHGAKKYVNSFTLNKGGIINLYDSVAKAHWQEYGLADLWPDLAKVTLDYLMIGDLKGSDGAFYLDMNDKDKSKTDMIYILNSTAKSNANFVQSYSEDQFQNISADNTLRFASVAAAAADTAIFKDSENIYGESLWDYNLRIGHTPYDLGDPENAIYNGSRDGITAAQLDNLLKGGTNWFIYSFVKTPSMSTLSTLNSAAAEYDVGTYLDRYNKRHGEAKFLDPDSNIWVRLQRGAMARENDYDGNYTMGEIGYEAGKGNNHYGVAFEYMSGKATLAKANGTVENTRKSLMLYDTMTKDDGTYLDLVGRLGRVSDDLSAVNTNTGVPVKGDYSISAYSFSAEYGRKFQKKDSKDFFEPQVQLQYAYLGDVDYTTSNGINAHQDGAKSLIGRLGFRLGRNIGKDLGNENASDSTIYLKADILREFMGGQDIHLSAARTGYTQTYDTTTEARGTWYDVGIGTDLKLSKKAYFTCDLERSFGGRLGKNWEANFAFKFAF
jgi:outer membrane autotransporter protein